MTIYLLNYLTSSPSKSRTRCMMILNFTSSSKLSRRRKGGWDKRRAPRRANFLLVYPILHKISCLGNFV